MKNVLVSGVSGGLGKAVAVAFLKNGDRVFGIDKKQSELSHDNFYFVNTDITDKDSLLFAFSFVSSKTDSLDAIINAAGIMFMGSIIEQDCELMKKILDVNVAGMAMVNCTFFPLIEQNKGRIINFSSEYGKYLSMPFHGFYTASKHAVEAYNDSLRRELSALNIKVTAIRPGAFATDMTASSNAYFEQLVQTTKRYKKAYNKLLPFMKNATKKAAPPEKIGNLVVKIVYSKKPKKAYKINNDKLIKTFSFLPSPLADAIFKKFMK